MSSAEPKVLVVDDDPTVCRALEARLGSAGYRVATVMFGKQALAACVQDPPDVLILDVDLPDMDGFEVCERVREQVDAPDMAIVFLTGTTHSKSGACLEQATGQSGGDYFLSKPYDGTLLLNLLDEVVLGGRTHPKSEDSLPPPGSVEPESELVPAKRTILVADDDRGMRECLRARLESAGFNVVVATGGNQAIDALNEKTPDAVVLDAMMPDVNGLSVCEAIRSTEASKDVPVIFLSGAQTPSQGYVERCARIVGATHFLSKPCDQNKLLKLLESVTSERAVVTV